MKYLQNGRHGFSTDTDIPLLSGDCCVSIEGFSHKNVQIVCTSKANLEKVLKFIPDGSNAKMVDAENPIFQGISDHWLRALMMVILGCDVYTSGLKGCGITTLSKHISACNNTEDTLKDESVLFQHLLQITKKEFKSRLIDIIIEIYGKESENFADIEAVEVVQTYIDALVYEPTNAKDEL